jgi:hypothetical protein
LNIATAKGIMGYYINSKPLKLLIHVCLYILILSDYTLMFPLVGRLCSTRFHSPYITCQVQKKYVWKLIILYLVVCENLRKKKARKHYHMNSLWHWSCKWNFILGMCNFTM